MRRGFKAWCERAAGEYREALGIPPEARLDAQALAESLGVRVATPEQLPGLPAASIEQLTVTDPDSWSAVTVSQGGVSLVILNSGQSARRRANSLCHELAHLLLNHRSDDATLSRQGFLFRASFNAEQEQEAEWLAGCLLVPAEGLLRAYRKTSSPERLAEHFGVSRALIDWRLSMTGVPKRVRPRARSSPAQTRSRHSADIAGPTAR